MNRFFSGWKVHQSEGSSNGIGSHWQGVVVLGLSRSRIRAGTLRWWRARATRRGTRSDWRSTKSSKRRAPPSSPTRRTTAAVWRWASLVATLAMERPRFAEFLRFFFVSSILQTGTRWVDAERQQRCGAVRRPAEPALRFRRVPVAVPGRHLLQRRRTAGPERPELCGRYATLFFSPSWFFLTFTKVQSIKSLTYRGVPLIPIRSHDISGNHGLNLNKTKRIGIDFFKFS